MSEGHFGVGTDDEWLVGDAVPKLAAGTVNHAALEGGQMKRWISGCAAAVLLIGAPAAAGGDKMKQGAMGSFRSNAPQQLVQQVKERVEQVERSWNAHDVDGLLEAYSDDATLMTPLFAATGKKEIRQKLQQSHGGELKNTQVEMEVLSVRQLNPNVAVADIRQQMRGAPAGMPDEFHISAVLMKEGKEWKAQAVRSFPAPSQQTGVGGAGEAGEPMHESGRRMERPMAPEREPETMPGTEPAPAPR